MPDIFDWRRYVTVEPWPHQWDMIEFACTRPSTLWAAGTGTGKTLAALYTVLARGCDTCLVICPKHVMRVWEREVPDKAATPVDVVPLPSKYYTTKRKADIVHDKTRSRKPDDPPTIFVCNQESVWRDPLGGVLRNALLDAVIVDESHNIKAAGSRVAQFAYNLGKHVPLKIAMSGTPMAEGPLDLYGQMRFLNPRVFGTNYQDFQHEYAVLRPGPNIHAPIIVGYKNQDEMMDRVAPIMMEVPRSVLVDLPEQVYTDRSTTLDKESRRVYKELMKDFLAWVREGEAVTANNALTKMLRLQQVVHGWVKPDDGELTKVNTAKADLLRDTLQELGRGEPVVVFYQFKTDLLDIWDEVNEYYGRKTGDQSACLALSGDYDQVDLWNDEVTGYDSPVLAVQIQAGNAGIDLTRARYAIYYGMTWSGVRREQSEARLHRPGQTRNVTYINLVVEDTTDDLMIEALRNKKDVVQDVMGKLTGSV